MNLAIEYLVRTGVVKQLFKPPLSLFLEKENRRLVVSIRDLPDSYHVIHWNLLTLADDGLPEQQSYFVPKSELFSSEHVVLSGFSLLPYAEQPLETGKNDYNHPMQAETFETCIKHYLNSKHHQRMRVLWLWCLFTDRFFNRPFDCWSNYGIDAEYERFIVHQEHPEKWAIWCNWEKHMLLTGPVAGELLFKPVYQIKQKRLFNWDTPF